MSLTPVQSAHALLSNPQGLANNLKELQGLNVSIVDGAAAGTAMTLAGIRAEDTILCATVLADTWAAPTDDKANITIQSTTASGTITFGGNPVEGETVTVNGNVYTFKATPTKLNDAPILAGNNNGMATALAAAINAYEGRYESQLHGDGNRAAGVSATANAAVVTVTSVVDGVGNAPAVTGTATVLVAAGSNTGAATLTAATVVAGNTCVVNGVTFTAAATPTLDTQFAVKGTNALQAAEIARAINAYAFKYGTLDVVASAAAAVVTIRPGTPASGNAIGLTESATNVTVSGSGYLAGGTNTGSIKSTTNLSAATLQVHWFNKR